jgi:tetratricopeptide (TPR) repeat protein
MKRQKPAIPPPKLASGINAKLRSPVKKQHNATLTAAVALHRQGQLEQAEVLYQEILQSQPQHLGALHLLAMLAAQRQDAITAIKLFDRALAIKPDFTEALNNRGNSLLDLQRPAQALESYDRALAIQPNYALALYNRGNALCSLRRPVEALDSYAGALAIQPNFAEAHWYAGMCHLAMGEFALGWPKYEWRWQSAAYKHNLRPFRQPLWLGAPSLNNKTILLHSEQGLGDTLQFCRYARQVTGLGAKVLLEVQPCLKALMTGLQGVATVLAKGEELPDFDYHCPLMSLPLAFHTDIDSIPHAVPYLFAEQDRILRWRKQFAHKGFMIGIHWQGSTSAIDIGRSFPLTHFQNIAKIPNVRLICLQKNAGAEQLHAQPEGMQVETPGADFDAGDDAFLDSAAVMQQLDLIISSDTAIAHLAGALGCPVWLALKQVPDWRWMLEGGQSPWYPSMRLFRQRRNADWEGVFNEIYTELLKLIKDNSLC